MLSAGDAWKRDTMRDDGSTMGDVREGAAAEAADAEKASTAGETTSGEVRRFADAAPAESADEAVANAQAGANAGTAPGDVAGLGVDIVEIERMRAILARTPGFRTRVYSEQEQAYCEGKSHPEVHYALFFAAKEAVLKALGTGFAGMAVTDVEVDHDRFGRPLVVLHGHAREVADEQGIVDIYLSLSYTASVGVASAVAAKEEHRPHREEKLDPKAELAAQFRELRSMIDELDGKIAQIEQGEAEGSADGAEAPSDLEDAQDGDDEAVYAEQDDQSLASGGQDDESEYTEQGGESLLNGRQGDDEEDE